MALLIDWIPEHVRATIRFELRSKLGRMRAPTVRLNSEQPNYINLGSGPAPVDSFINIDFFGSPQAMGADLRYPLNLPSECTSGLFTEHALEHLSYLEVQNLLNECFRVLRPSGLLRVIVPDIALFIRHYYQGNSDWFAEWERVTLLPRGRKLSTMMEALSFVTQEYGHRSSWDFETMEYFMRRAGFVDILRSSFRQGVNPDLLKDMDAEDRKLVSLYIECRKPQKA